MEVNTVPNQEYLDIFSDPKAQIASAPLQEKTGFGFEPVADIDLFAAPPKEQAEPIKAEESPENTKEKPADEKPKDADILGGDEPVKAGRKPKYDFSDASGYFEDRFKSGKFVGVEEEVDGEVRTFIPKTPEEFDEVIDIQVRYQLDQKQKQLEDNWYQGKSPAWQTVAKYAEMTKDPSELIPFIQGVQNIDSISEMDENEIDGAEQIVRRRLEQSGEPKATIDDQIDMLKTTDKLISRAKQYKPIIVQQEQQFLQQMVQQKRQEEVEVEQLVTSIRNNAIKSIETPLFGKIKLKTDEKNAIYDLIGEPSEQTGGYPIYSKIDEAFEKGDFDTLRLISLVFSKKDALFNYIKNDAKQEAGEQLQRTLRVAGEKKIATTTLSEDLADETHPQTVNRQTYNRQPRFGRG